MVDVLTAEQRRLNMSRIKGGDTKPELLIRRSLHGLGFRYRLHVRALPGRPDIVLPRYQSVIFVHGCFWHGHHCHLVKKPATRAAFWDEKFVRNRARDRDAIAALQRAGWKIAIIWECALRGATRQPLGAMIRRIANYVTNGKTSRIEFEGKPFSACRES